MRRTNVNLRYSASSSGEVGERKAAARDIPLSAAEPAAPPPSPYALHAAVSLSGVGVTFATDAGPVEALRNIDLTVGKQEFVSIVGPSGCGKSTILRVVADLVQPSAGKVSALGTTARDARLSRSFGFVFQNSVMLPWLTALDNVKLPLDVIGMRSERAPIPPAKLLEMVGLGGYAHLYPRQLSGGMRQRVAIARALSFDPPILLMDEPFAAVDALTRQRLHALLLDIWNTSHKTVLFITHDVYEAVMLSDRVLVMSRSPGCIETEVAIDLPRPRTQKIKTDPYYVRLCGQVLDLLMQS
jgi:NitT/TauT family transport system ATP-binding protein